MNILNAAAAVGSYTVEVEVVGGGEVQHLLFPPPETAVVEVLVKNHGCHNFLLV
uniref:Uncharacterized protein n=1 Tax=Solanum lycopersicum TaxID=4081 RepID=A0A3Q7H1D6_SOLLC